MLHEEGAQLVFFRFRPECSRNFLVSRFRAVPLHDFCRVAGGLPEEQLHVRFPVLLGDFGETTDYEDRELLEFLRNMGISIFHPLDESTSVGHYARYNDAIKASLAEFIASQYEKKRRNRIFFIVPEERPKSLILYSCYMRGITDEEGVTLKRHRKEYWIRGAVVECYPRTRD